ncbi:DUF6950 family protein [Ochrobactrum sp. MYb379]|uniref:DUF6950 family protein n=1 Tax=Ochrobactrum sp. MYb379 TaxID=2745275 RepID=UPI0030A6F187
MTIKRYHDWRTRLSAYLYEVAHKPFQWGVHDCALFAAGAVEAMTGEDFAADYRGKYKTLIGGLRKLRKSGFDDHAAMAASLFEECHPSSAHVGDLAAIETDQGIALGVVQGQRIYVLRPDQAGIGTVALLDAKRTFHVPFH